MRLIPLTKGFFAKVDTADYERVSKHSWCLLDLRKHRRGLLYAQSRIDTKIVYLHRFVRKVTDSDIEVDHRNGDGLDCRKRNLRVTDRLGNSRNRRQAYITNTTGVNGVSWDASRRKFKVDISVRGKVIYVGRYTSLQEARRARKTGGDDVCNDGVVSLGRWR